MYRVILILAAGILAIALLVGCGGDQSQMENQTQTQQQPAQQPAETMAETETATEVKAYPLNYCIVSGEELGSMGDPIVKTYEGHEVKLCCNMCVPKFEANPAMYLAKIDSAAAMMNASGEGDGSTN